MTSCSAPQDWTIRVQEIAAHLLSEHESEYRLSAEDLKLLSTHQNEDFSVKDGTLSFNDKTIIGEMALGHHLRSFSTNTKATPQDWFLASIALRRDRKASHQFIEQTVNQLDPLGAASELVEDGRMDIWDILHTIHEAIPYIENINIQSLIDFSITHYPRTKNDFFFSRLYNVIKEKIAGNEQLCLDILAKLRSSFEDSLMSLYTSCVLCLSEIDPKNAYTQAHIDLSSDQIGLKRCALWVLGQMSTLGRVDENQRQAALQKCEEFSLAADEDLRNTSIQVICQNAIHHDAFAKILNPLLSARDSDALYCLLHALQPADLNQLKSNQNYENWILALKHLPISAPKTGQLNEVDILTSKMLEANQTELVTSFIGNWLVTQHTARDINITDVLSMTFDKICETPRTISLLITRWLTSPQLRLSAAAQQVLDYHKLHEKTLPSFCIHTLNSFTHNDYLLLVRRLLGYCYDEDILLSLSRSLLDVDNAEQRTYGFVEALWSNEIGMDYPKDTLKVVNEIIATTEDQMLLDMCHRIVGRINEYFDKLSTLNRTKELAPNTEWERKVMIARGDTIAKHTKNARKTGIMETLGVVSIPMKAGRACFSYHEGEYSPPSGLHTFEQSMSLPRRHVTDNVGYEFRRLGFRNAQRDDE